MNRDDGFLDSHASGEAPRAVTAAARMGLVGRRLGPYEIVAPLGAGGMGEVYRARDSRLERSVAIKVMPPHLAADREARQRFEREARAISNLAHPHICALHDVGSHDGTDFLVMELVEGETLATRLQRGPVPLPDALRWAAQIADALDRAHRAGIVHRDLKPGNVMLTRNGVKLLDFGLARRTAPVRGSSLSAGPTRVAEPLTAEGAILGTLHYMAPEQLEGRVVDQRADVFAFGAVLYELVTGARAFDGDTPASIISSILRDRPPPVSARVPISPEALDRLVEHCLAKDPEDRWQSAHDVRLQLLAIADAKPAPAAAERSRARRLPWAVAALAVATAVAAGVLAMRRSVPEPTPALRFQLPAPSGGRYYHSVEHVTMALSPDGSQLAFVALPLDGSTSAVWIRRLDELAARPVQGTDGAGSLFWSPDGEHLGFVSGGQLKRVAVDGGTPLVLCEVEAGGGISGTWGRGSILFASAVGGVIQRVAENGGVPSVVVRADAARDEQRVAWPWFLPDGERFLYLSSGSGARHELRLASADEPPRTVAPMSSRVEVVHPGFAVFVRDGALLAQRLDVDRAELVGAPLPLSPAVRSFGSTGSAAFAVSRGGTVVVGTDNDLHQLILYAADGQAVGTVGATATANSLAVSADGRRALVDRLRSGPATYDLWLLDLERGVETRLTEAPGTEVYPLWLPDGSVVYSSTRTYGPNLLRRDLATGREQWLVPGGGFQVVVAATPDGRRLLYRQRRGTGFDLVAVPLAGGTPEPVLPPGRPVADAALSPDGRLLAYVSPEAGRPELFVRPLAGGESVRVSRDGAWLARFSRDSETLFFTTGDGKMAAVQLSATPALTVGLPETRFTPPARWIDFETLPDGRFLALERRTDGMTAPLTVIAGWTPPAR